MPLKILIVDAYTANGRKSALDAGAHTAGLLFERAVRLFEPDAEIDIIEFSETDIRPPRPLDAYDGVVWSGSNLTIHRRNPLIDAQIALSQTAFDKGTPQFGCCYALQLATVAAGGDVQANPKGLEIAWARDVTLTKQGRAHPMFEGKSGQFDALCWHSDTVTELPETADLLAGNDFSSVQAAILRRGEGEFWATQYHLEFDGHEVACLVQAYGPSQIDAGVFTGRDQVDALTEEMRAVKALENDPDQTPPALEPVASPRVRMAEIGNWLAHLREKPAA
ncbi:MAG: type 1 glutamine amidotransferase [Alphaproteobacteria bacterium]